MYEELMELMYRSRDDAQAKPAVLHLSPCPVPRFGVGARE